MIKKIKVELHVHTKYSYDSDSSLHKIIEICKKKNIDVLGVADHNEIRGAFRLQKIAPFRVIVGQEILSKDGEVIGFFLKEFIKSGLSMVETIKAIKAQGGISYLPHPYDSTTRKTSVSTDKLIQTAKIVDIIEVHNGRTILYSDNTRAVRLAKENDKPEGVGSDAHTLFEFGRNYLLMNDFKIPSEFLESVKTAKLFKKHVMPWVFIITKWQRFVKKKKKILSFQQDIACDLCGEDLATVLYKKKGQNRDEYLITDNSYGDHSQIVKCIGCNLVYASPRDDNRKLEDRYKRFADPLYEEERNARSSNQSGLLNRLGHLGTQGTLLDVGCATGGLLEQAIKVGWKAFGVELSGWASKIAIKRSLSVTNKPLEKAGFKDEYFDAVTCIDVIEHVDSPRKLLSQIHVVLKKGGLVCIVTPNKDSFFARFLGERWWHIRQDHIYYFSQETLSALLVSSGFKIERIQSYGWSFSYDYWASRFQKKVNIIYSFLMLLKKIPILNIFTNRTYTLNFGDSLEIYCRKV